MGKKPNDRQEPRKQEIDKQRPLPSSGKRPFHRALVHGVFDLFDFLRVLSDFVILTGKSLFSKTIVAN